MADHKKQIFQNKTSCHQEETHLVLFERLQQIPYVRTFRIISTHSSAISRW